MFRGGPYGANNDYAVLRQFKGNSSLATYLTVIARRICVHELARRSTAREIQPYDENQPPDEAERVVRPKPRSTENLEEVEKLLKKSGALDEFATAKAAK